MKCVKLRSTKARYVELSEEVKTTGCLCRAVENIRTIERKPEIVRANSRAVKWDTGHFDEDCAQSMHVEIWYNYMWQMVDKGSIAATKVITLEIIIAFLSNSLKKYRKQQYTRRS